MDPSKSVPKTDPTLVRDVGPPTSLKTEIVNNIPVKNPVGAPSTSGLPPTNPSNQFPQPVVINPTQNTDDKELDHILKDVNRTVKRTENSIEAKLEHLSGVRKKVAIKKAKIDKAHQGSPPIAATIIACLVALGLSIAAAVVFKQ